MGMYFAKGKPVGNYRQQIQKQPKFSTKIKDPWKPRFENVTLQDAIAEILYFNPQPLSMIKQKIGARTPLKASIDDIQQTVNQMTKYDEEKDLYQLKREFAKDVNWKHSLI